MIRDARVLRAGSVPREVGHRDAAVNHLSSILEPITNGEPVDTAIVTELNGTGKTCISKFVTGRLREEVLNLKTTYVNCWRNYTRFRTLYRILETSVRPSTFTAGRRPTMNSSTASSSMMALE